MKTVEQIEAESLSQVVAKVFDVPVTRAQLSRAFDAVANRQNWKMPIDAVVELDSFGIGLTAEAVVFFTGSRPTFEPTTNSESPKALWRVKAAGYYLTCGA